MTLFDNAVDHMRDCPFCGLHDLTMDTSPQTGWWYVTCNDCGATGPIDSGESGAIDSWDHRDYDED